MRDFEINDESGYDNGKLRIDADGSREGYLLISTSDADYDENWWFGLTREQAAQFILEMSSWLTKEERLALMQGIARQTVGEE